MKNKDHISLSKVVKGYQKKIEIKLEMRFSDKKTWFLKKISMRKWRL